MRSPFADWLRAYADRTRELQTQTATLIGRAGKLAPGATRPQYIFDIGRKRWGTLAKRARGHRRNVEAGMVLLRTAQRTFAPVVERLPQVGTAARLSPIPAQRPDFDAATDMVRTAMRAANKTDAEIDGAIAWLRGFDPNGAGEVLSLATKRWAAKIDQLARRHRSVAMGANLAIAVARFNQAVAKPPVVHGTPADYLARVNADLDLAERRLHQALRAGDPFVAWARAVELRRASARRLLAGAIPHAALLANQRKAAPNDARLIGLSVDMGALIRRLLTAVAVGAQVEWAAAWGKEGEAFRDWRAAAASTRIGTGYRWPRPGSLRSLAQKPERWDGDARTITGRVEDVVITHQRRKAISTGTITDGTRSVRIVLAHLKIDSGGLVPGAAVRIAGTWRLASKEAANQPALEVDRKSIAALGATFWSERMLHEVESTFTPVPHGIAAEWSWEPGPNGAGNQLQYETWFGGTKD